MVRGDGRFGVSTALLTPWIVSGGVDADLLSAHAASCLRAGADSVTLFGTTGEGASVGATERQQVLAAILSSGISASDIILGVCAPAVADAADQIAEGARLGLTRFLVLPPFYFKEPDDTGLFDWHRALVDSTPADTKLILYHIPQLSGTPLSPDLVRLLAAYAPSRFIAIKDSSADWNTAEALITGQPLPVLVGDERLLHRAVSIGSAGCISGVANLYPERLKHVVATGVEDTALSCLVDQIVRAPVLAALKFLMFEQTNHPSWDRMRAPLTTLTPENRIMLRAALAKDQAAPQYA